MCLLIALCFLALGLSLKPNKSQSTYGYSLKGQEHQPMSYGNRLINALISLSLSGKDLRCVPHGSSKGHQRTATLDIYSMLKGILFLSLNLCLLVNVYGSTKGRIESKSLLVYWNRECSRWQWRQIRPGHSALLRFSSSPASLAHLPHPVSTGKPSQKTIWNHDLSWALFLGYIN